MQPKADARRRILVRVTDTGSALGDLRKLLRPLAENVTDPFWVKDREGRFVLVNQAALRHLGATSEKDVVGRTDFDFSSDELASQYRADDERVLESGQPLVDKEMLSPDAAGVNHRFSMTKVPTRDASGTIVGLVGIARDITASTAVETERARLVEEQGALRRVATLVANGVHADELYAAVTQEAARVLHTEAVGMVRLEPDGSATLVAQSDTPWEPPPLGTRLTLEGDNVFAEVLRTGQAARVDDWANSSGSVVAIADVLGVRSTVATPIVVEGRLWGIMVASTNRSEPLPGETESRIRQFTELVATAIANADAHGDVQLLADEQAALRRIATLVAQGLAPEAISRAVAEEAGLLFDADLTVLGRFDEGSAVATGSWSASGEIIPEGTRSALGGKNVLSQVAETLQPARLDSYDDATGEAAEIARRFGWRSSIAAPVVTEGSVWGVMLVASTREAPFPAGAEQRLAAFTELLATAVSNAQAGDRLRRLANEQAALRRVAMYVAEGASSSALCTLVVEEVARALEVPSAWLIRYEPERMASVVASVNAAGFPIGGHWPLEGSSVSASVFDTGGPARIDDYSAQPGRIAAQTREFGITSAVGVPITLDGATWGAVCIATNGAEPLPADLEARLSRFTDLVATAISNAEAHDEVRGLLDEQAALRRVATLVAESAPPHDVFTAVCDDVARLFGLERIEMVRYAADGWGTVVAASGDHPFVAGSRWNAEDPSVLRAVSYTHLTLPTNREV